VAVVAQREGVELPKRRRRRRSTARRRAAPIRYRPGGVVILGSHTSGEGEGRRKGGRGKEKMVKRVEIDGKGRGESNGGCQKATKDNE